MSGKGTGTGVKFDPSTKKDDSISLQRSDQKHFDLATLRSPSLSTVISQSQKEQAEREAALKEANASHADESIRIKRSDGVLHDIISVFRAKSDPRGESLHLREKAQLTETKPRISLTKLDMQSILSGFKSSSAGSADQGLPMQSLQACSFHPTSVRIVHMSDTHSFVSKNPDLKRFLPAGDILVHSGDFTNEGNEEEYTLFNDFLGYIKNIYQYRVICIGKRDVKIFGNDWDRMKSLLTNATHILCHEEETVLGLRFYGVPWHWGYKTNGTLRRGAPVVNRYEDVPEGIDVLVTHSAAYGRLDTAYSLEGSDSEHWGSRELLECIQRAKPSLHLHGHVHESRGVLPAHGNYPMTLNSSMVDKNRSVLYACPHVIRAIQVFSGGSDEDQISFGSKHQKLWEFTIDSLV